MIAYVVGLLFNENYRTLALLEKKRPEWQKGLWNGCGGRVESGESPLQAMHRECLEEFGLNIPESEWTHFITMQCTNAAGEKVESGRQILFFTAHTTQMYQARSTTDEIVGIHDVRIWLTKKLLPNLYWMIPFAANPCTVLPIYIVEDPNMFEITKRSRL